jgi:hypothetical protein
LVILASSVLNIAGGSGFSRIGRADPTHARSAVRRLLGVGRQIEEARSKLDDGLPPGSTDLEVRQAASIAAALLRAIQTQLLSAIADWNDVHQAALREVLEQEGGGDR